MFGHSSPAQTSSGLRELLVFHSSLPHASWTRHGPENYGGGEQGTCVIGVTSDHLLLRFTYKNVAKLKVSPPLASNQVFPFLLSCFLPMTLWTFHTHSLWWLVFTVSFTGLRITMVTHFKAWQWEAFQNGWIEWRKLISNVHRTHPWAGDLDQIRRKWFEHLNLFLSASSWWVPCEQLHCAPAGAMPSSARLHLNQPSEPLKWLLSDVWLQKQEKPLHAYLGLFYVCFFGYLFLRQVSWRPLCGPGTHYVNKAYRLAPMCPTLGVVFLTPCKSASCSHWIHSTHPKKSSWPLKTAFPRGLSCFQTCQSMYRGSLNASYWPPDIPFGKPCLSSVISARPMAPKLVWVQVLLLMLHIEKALPKHPAGSKERSVFWACLPSQNFLP